MLSGCLTSIKKSIMSEDNKKQPPKPPKNAKHVRDDATAQEVETLSSYGIPQVEIAAFVGVSVNTLTKYYREELDNAGTRLVMEAAGQLMRKVRGGDIAAIIFTLKTRGKGRWNEKHIVELDSRGENLIGGIDPSLLTDEELEMFNKVSDNIRERMALLESD